MNDNKQLPAESTGSTNSTPKIDTSKPASKTGSTKKPNQTPKPKAAKAPVKKSEQAQPAKKAGQPEQAGQAGQAKKAEQTKQAGPGANSKTEAASPKPGSQAKKTTATAKKTTNAATSSSSSAKAEKGSVSSSNVAQKPKPAAQKTAPQKKATEAKSSPQKSSTAKDTAQKSPSSQKQTQGKKQTATKQPPAPADVASEESPFNLHQQTDLWPEAWPDSHAIAHAQNEKKQNFNRSLEQTAKQSTPSTSEELDNLNSSSQNDLKEPNSIEADYAQTENAQNQPSSPAIVDQNEQETLAQNQPDHPNQLDQPDQSTNIAPETHADNEQTAKQKSNRNAKKSSRGAKQQKAASPEKPETQAKPSKSTGQSKKKWNMYISVLPDEQIEVVITEGGQVQEYYVQMLHQLKTKGNIYKGVIHNVDANLQAAFVSYGAAKNGFLQIDEVHPEYYLTAHETAKGKKYPLIQKVLKAGQEVLVQVIKEPTGGKGAFLSTYLSMPGRFLVLTPGRTQLGVSRKVEDEGERERLRALLEGLPISEGLGVIVRTASLSASKTSMLKDLQFLKRLWKEVRTKGSNDPAPCLVYEEPSLASRAVRDYLNDDIAEIWVDNKATAEEIEETVSLIFPRRASSSLIKLHNDPTKSMWDALNLTTQLEQIFSREVTLPSGGRLVFDQTEALTAIDINSGKIAGRNNFESMALRTNMEAAESIAQQLRLRDIGGQIVIDFIEMRERNHWRELEKTIRNAMKSDRARFDVAKVSPFGLMEIVRQRLGSSATSITMEPCPCCAGRGMRRNMEWQSLRALHDIQYKLRQHQDPNTPVIYETEPEVALYLLNNKRSALNALENQFETTVEFKFGKK